VWIAATGWILWKFAGRSKTLGSPNGDSWGARAIATGSTGALAGLALHSLLDWNLHVPANALLATLVFGLWLAGREGAPRDAPRQAAAVRVGRAAPTPSVSWSMVRIWLTQAGAIGLLLLGARSAARDLLAERAIDPLRESLERFWEPTNDHRATVKHVPSLLPAAEYAAWHSGSWNADDATLIGRAYLHLSDGRRSPELILAYDWLARALERRPVDRTLRSTLEQISAILKEDEKRAAPDTPSL
jgi:hypothetical protein